MFKNLSRAIVVIVSSLLVMADVHAHWAPYNVSARTGNMAFSNAATADLPNSQIAAELSYMQSKVTWFFC